MALMFSLLSSSGFYEKAHPKVRNSAMVAKSGRDMGSTIRVKMLNWEQPSICADSIMASWMEVLKNFLQITT